MTTALERGERSASSPGRSWPTGKDRYPLYRRLGEPQGRSGQVRKISPPPGFDPLTVQPVASRYTDWATRPVQHISYTFIYTKLLNFISGNKLNSIGSVVLTEVTIKKAFFQSSLAQQPKLRRDLLPPFSGYCPLLCCHNLNLASSNLVMTEL